VLSGQQDITSQLLCVPCDLLGGLSAQLCLAVCAYGCRTGYLLDEVYGQEVMFVANDWHAALLPLLLTARFRWASYRSHSCNVPYTLQWQVVPCAGYAPSRMIC
jgi:hypothetical protein